jgi:uncharacterized protein (DUF4415 family)
MTTKYKTKRRKATSKTAVKKGRRIASLQGTAEKNAPAWLGKMQDLYKPIKKSVTLRLDADVLAWFKREGRGYQTRINRALRDVMVKVRKSAR